MSNEMTLFGGDNPLANSDLFKQALKKNEDLGGGGGSSIPRISIRGSRFRKIVGGEQVEVSDSQAMNIIVVNFSTVSRTYYDGSYDPENPSAPTCWSHDTKTPSKDVEEPQHINCVDCPKNVKGSGQGNSRACRFSQRFAVCIEGDLSKVYQLSVPATSLFGDAENGNMPMQAYGKLLRANDAPIQAVVTEMSFDKNSDTPKLFFRPVRPLTAEEFETVMGMQGREDVAACIEMTVAQADGVQKIASDKDSSPVEEKPKAKAKTAKEESQPEPEVEEPKKAKSTKPVVEEPDEDEDDLAAIIDDWDDD